MKFFLITNLCKKKNSIRKPKNIPEKGDAHINFKFLVNDKFFLHFFGVLVVNKYNLAWCQKNVVNYIYVLTKTEEHMTRLLSDCNLPYSCKIRNNGRFFLFTFNI